MNWLDEIEDRAQRLAPVQSADVLRLVHALRGAGLSLLAIAKTDFQDVRHDREAIERVAKAMRGEARDALTKIASGGESPTAEKTK